MENRNMKHVYALLGVSVVLAACAAWQWSASPELEARAGEAKLMAQPTVVCCDKAARDQDDMCLWVHPRDRSLSTIIASDKAAGKVLVYDLAGKCIQTVASKQPGNIDLRYGVSVGGKAVDVVALNERQADRIHVYAVDPNTRQIGRIDDGEIAAPGNYGGALYHSRKTGRLHFFSACGDRMEQIEIRDDGKGKLAGRKVRSWKTSVCEGVAGDDERGTVYVGEESKGVWCVGGEPNDPAPGKLVAAVGEHGLRQDVEGVAIYDAGGGKGYLLVSSQGSSDFKVYQRGGEHAYVGTFSVLGASSTDGIEVCTASLGKAFPKGVFACHSDQTVRGACPVLLTPWEKIAELFRPPLSVAPSWEPRKTGLPPVPSAARSQLLSRDMSPEPSPPSQ